MLLDIFVLGLLIMAIWKGWRNGLVLGLFSFLALVIGLAAAMKFSAVMAAYLNAQFNISERWLPVIAFAGVFLVVLLLVWLGAKAIEGVLEMVLLGWVNRLGGIIFYGMIYLFIASVLFYYAGQAHLISEEASQNSVTYSVIEPLAPGLMKAFGYIFPFFKNLFS